SAVLHLAPWIIIATLLVAYTLWPRLNGLPAELPPALFAVLATVTLLVQLGRRSARRTAAGAERDVGKLRAAWRRTSLTVFGADLPRLQIEALGTTHFDATPGMIGILGPNG